MGRISHHIEPVADAFPVEDIRQMKIRILADIPVRSAQDDAHMMQVRMVHIRKVVHGIVKIYIVIIIPLNAKLAAV